MQVFDFRLPSGKIQGNVFECGINDIGLKSVTIMFVSMLGFWWTAGGPFVFNPSFSGTTRKGLNDDGYDDFVWLFPFDIWWQ